MEFITCVPKICDYSILKTGRGEMKLNYSKVLLKRHVIT